MSKEIQIFQNKQFGQIRTIDENGKVLFCAKDVAEALGYSNTRDAINRHCRGVVKRDAPTSSGNQSMSFIPEGDIYRLAASSELPGADSFESWIFDEVLPAIRKTGTYTLDAAKRERMEIMQRNSRTREAALWLKIGQAVESASYKQICASYASRTLAGSEVIPLPRTSQHHYTASEIGEMLDISARRVGSIANANGMKTEEYGAWYHDKAKHSAKEVDVFRYNDKAVERFREILGVNEIA